MQSFSRTPLSFWCLIPSSQWQCINRSEEGRCLEKRLNDWDLRSNVLNITFHKFLQLQRFIYFCDLSPSFQKCKDENKIFKTIFTKLLTPIAKQHEQVKMISMFKTTQWPSFSHRNKGNKYIACKLLLLSSYIILCWSYLLVMCVTHKYHQLQSNFLVLSDGCWESGFFVFVFLHWV